MKSKNISQNVDEYISTFPKEVQTILEYLRNTIKKAAPKAEEKISYNMPAYFQNGVLIYFAAYKNHIGFYPTANGIRAFLKEITNYKHSKGAVQFPVDRPLPIELISKIVKFRVQENYKKVRIKAKRPIRST